MVESEVTPAGGEPEVHVTPESFETMMEEKLPDPSSPPATHVLEGLGAHEIARTFASGENLAVVSHWGTVADAGPGASALPNRPTSVATAAEVKATTKTLRTVPTVTSLHREAQPDDGTIVSLRPRAFTCLPPSRRRN